MQSDEIVWAVINHQFCSFKARLPGQNGKAGKSAKRSGNAGGNSQVRTFCKHPDSLTGLCGRAMCPLANSRYATVRTDDRGRIHLRIKEIERSHLPSQLWREVLLPTSVKEAIAKIDTELAYWPRAMRNRVKQRLLRLRQVQLRSRKLLQKREREGGQVLVTDPKKVARRERKREAMAERAAEVDVAVKSELLERLRQGTYGSIYNLDAAFDKVVAQERADQEPVDQDEEESGEFSSGEEEREYEYEEEDSSAEELFVGEVSSDEDGDDVEDLFVDLGPASAAARAAHKRTAAASGSSMVRAAKRRRHVEIEVETEQREEEREAATD